MQSRYLAASIVGLVTVALAAADRPPFSPAAIVALDGGRTLAVAGATARQIRFVSAGTGKALAQVPLECSPHGLAPSADGRLLFAACGGIDGRVIAIDVASRRTVDSLGAGHTPSSVVPSADGRILYVCNRFNNDVSFIDLRARREVRRVPVRREPTSAALTRDGRSLLVTNFLHDGPADSDYVSATVSVIDVSEGRVVKELRLPNGSGQLQAIAVSPDGLYAGVTHVIGRFYLPASQLERGWMNTNALTLIDLQKMEIAATVLLDGIAHGAANPWGLVWAPDGKTLVVAHSGAHEVSLIDFPALLDRLARGPAGSADDLAFLTGIRRIIRMPASDRGPRAVTVIADAVYAANYFSDSVVHIRLAPAPSVRSMPLEPRPEPDLVRQGEIAFHDAALCFQEWQSCSSCHPGGARTDALNWDLLNDGIGNSKNTKSLLLSHRTAPAMSLGVRDTAETAVRSGIRNILLTEQPETVARSIDAYLKSLRPEPSPRLRDGKLSDAARRGEALFKSAEVGCADCHPSGLFTDMKSYDVGTGARYDTPTLVEAWRTGPYLHDGSAATMRDVLVTQNRKDRHGKTSHLTSRQIDDLIEYLDSI